MDRRHAPRSLSVAFRCCGANRVDYRRQVRLPPGARYFLRAAEKMPAADYAFKPSPDVRTFARIVAHVADDQYNLCGAVRTGASRNAPARLHTIGGYAVVESGVGGGAGAFRLAQIGRAHV